MSLNHLPITLIVLIFSIGLYITCKRIFFTDDVMANCKMDSPLPSCKFCQIIGENGSDLIYQDEDYVSFRDIKPATPHHYVVIPRKHLPNAKFLSFEDIPTIEKLVEVGKKIIIQEHGDIDNIRLGFHWYPFNSIAHLHMHAISSLEEMSWVSRTIFKANSYWFVKPEDVIGILKEIPPVVDNQNI